MRRSVKIVGGVLLVLSIAVGAFNYAIQRDSPCPETRAIQQSSERMTAMVHRCYGGPQVLALESVSKPAPAGGEVLIKVHAAGFNPHDWHAMRGTPYLIRTQTGFGAPANPLLGIDFAGTVEAVGKNVTQFHPGDEVFGGADGSFAEYVTVADNQALVAKPTNLTFEEAASVPVAALSALQALRDRAGTARGDKVLINGASGGVGTFAVQLAKWMGAEVTGVCSERNAQLVRDLGADHVIDYTQNDFTKGDERYDVIIDKS
jgi:NADPH:quinone reductase-like Zn-dependent oxidoreductase